MAGRVDEPFRHEETGLTWRMDLGFDEKEGEGFSSPLAEDMMSFLISKMELEESQVVNLIEKGANITDEDQ